MRSRVVVRWIPSHPARPRATVATPKPGSRFRLLPRPLLSLPSCPTELWLPLLSCLASFSTPSTLHSLFSFLLSAPTPQFSSPFASWPSHLQPPTRLFLAAIQASSTPPRPRTHHYASTSHLRLRLSTASLSSQSTHRIEITWFDLALFNITQTLCLTASCTFAVPCRAEQKHTLARRQLEYTRATSTTRARGGTVNLHIAIAQRFAVHSCVSLHLTP